MRGSQIAEKLRDDGGLCNDFIFEDAIGDLNRRYEPSLKSCQDSANSLDRLSVGRHFGPYRIYLKIPRFPRSIEVNDYFLVRQAELLESDMSAMRPWTSVISVKSDLWRYTIAIGLMLIGCHCCD